MSLKRTLIDAIAPEPRKLDRATAVGLDEKLTAINRKRLVVFPPILVIVDLVHVAIFLPKSAVLDAATFAWRANVVAIHAWSALVIGALWLLYLKRWLPRPAVVFGLTSLVHGALIVGADQAIHPAATVFMGYTMGVGIILAFKPAEALFTFSIGTAVFVATMFIAQPDATLRMASIPPGVSFAVITVVLNLIFYFGRRRTFIQARTIDEQAAQLHLLNKDLEARVNEQVAVAMARTDEIYALNKQLRESVRERSQELSFALARLALAHDEQRIETGSVFAERFRIVELLGAGGMGAVYRAEDLEADSRPVALKIIQAASATQLDRLHRFLQEAEAAAKVEHPAVVRVFDIDVTEGGVLYQAQELIEGITLKARQPVPEALLLRVCQRVANALDVVHGAGVIHRDIKPSNIMLARGEVKLLDFGISKLADDDDLTASGHMLGTPRYMAPDEVVSHKVDVYSLGLILFEGFAGELPGDGLPVGHRLHLRSTQDAPSLENGPAGLSELVGACLARDPKARPTARELTAVLDEICAGLPSLVELLEKDVETWALTEETAVLSRSASVA